MAAEEAEGTHWRARTQMEAGGLLCLPLQPQSILSQQCHSARGTEATLLSGPRPEKSVPRPGNTPRLPHKHTEADCPQRICTGCPFLDLWQPITRGQVWEGCWGRPNCPPHTAPWPGWTRTKWDFGPGNLPTPNRPSVTHCSFADFLETGGNLGVTRRLLLRFWAEVTSDVLSIEWQHAS